MPLERCKTMDFFYRERKSESESFLSKSQFWLDTPITIIDTKNRFNILMMLGPVGGPTVAAAATTGVDWWTKMTARATSRTPDKNKCCLIPFYS